MILKSKIRVEMPNQWTKAKETGVPYILKQETRDKLSKSSGNRILSEEHKNNISKGMKLAVEKKPESYTSSNRGRTKQIIFDDIKFQGKWELYFYKWCKENNIKIIRSNEYFPYSWRGNRKYFPDFYLPDLDFYVEVKGYETERDRAKWNQFPKKLLVIKKKEINEILKNKFDVDIILKFNY